jgi:Helicase conserved C-terminal domain
VIGTTAKALGVPADTVDLVARLAIDLGLLLVNTVAVSGRGRNRRVDQVWLADPVLLAAWEQTPAVGRWSRLVASWCRPNSFVNQHQLLCNRHLVLWELSNLAPGMGYDGDEAFASWIAERYATLGVEGAVDVVLADLRVLGVIPPAGPLALTAVARRLFDDPASVAEGLGPADTSVVVQGDLTVLVPPGTDYDVHQRLVDLALVESDGAVQVLRLNEARITRAVQAGSSGETIIAFLRQVSSVPLVDAVTRLVQDAASRANRVTLTAATTVVLVSDPADLILACSVKGAKLEAVSDTVAISALPLDKVRAALDRKGLAPALTAGASSPPGQAFAPRSASGEAELDRIRARAGIARRAAEQTGNEMMRRQADRLDETAKKLADPRTRLEVPPVLALTPARAAAAFGQKPKRR